MLLLGALEDEVGDAPPSGGLLEVGHHEEVLNPTQLVEQVLLLLLVGRTQSGLLEGAWLQRRCCC